MVKISIKRFFDWMGCILHARVPALTLETNCKQGMRRPTLRNR